MAPRTTSACTSACRVRRTRARRGAGEDGPRESTRRRLLGPPAVLLHRVVARVAQMTIGRSDRAHHHPRPEAHERVTILLLHAWGMGGTIRSAFNLGELLAEHHEVEVLSLVRRRDR